MFCRIISDEDEDVRVKVKGGEKMAGIEKLKGK